MNAPQRVPPLMRVTRHGDRRPHAVVVGSGFGGLAAAVRLGARGYRVTVLERLDAAGGRAARHCQAGHVFDAGPTIVTAPFLFEELWRMARREFADDIELRPLSPFYRIRFDDGDVFNYGGDAEAMRAEVARFEPRDVAGYDRLMRHSEAVFDIAFTRLGHVSFHRFRSMLATLPDLLRLKSYRSVYGLVASHLRDPRLRQVFSFHPLLVGGNPFTTPSVYLLINHLERRYGVHYAMGGTHRLVEGLCRLVEGQGGTVRYGADVSSITHRARVATGVRLASGEHIAADIVVSNADSATTYGRLIEPAARRRWSDARLARARYSMGLFLWYFGTSRRYPEVPHHQILLGPRYRGLIEDIFDRRILASDFSLYLHRPTATDPALAPPGHDTFYVLSPVPNEMSGIDWERQAEPYRAAIARHLAATVLPGLEGAVVTSRVTTPRDFASRYLAPHGAAFGLAPLLTQSAWFRPHNRSEELANLFLVGAGTHPGAGLPGVLSSARVLDTLVPVVQPT